MTFLPLFLMCAGCSPPESGDSKAGEPVVARSRDDLSRSVGKPVIVESQMIVAGRIVQLWTESMGIIDLIGIEDSTPYEKEEGNTIRVHGLLTWRWKLRRKPIGIDDAYKTNIPQKEDVWYREYQITVSKWEVIEKRE